MTNFSQFLGTPLFQDFAENHIEEFLQLLLQEFHNKKVTNWMPFIEALATFCNSVESRIQEADVQDNGSVEVKLAGESWVWNFSTGFVKVQQVEIHAEVQERVRRSYFVY